MKTIKLILILIVVNSALFAHPPKESTIFFDKHSKILDVKIPHKIKKPRVHYIERIEVYLNNRLKIVQYFHQQVDKEKQEAQYLLTEAIDGDKIEVKIFCKLFGEVDRQLIVGGKNIAVKQHKKVVGLTPKFTVYEEPPTAIETHEAVYPEFAKKSGLEGEVWVDVEVLSDGSVGAVEIKRSLMPGPGGLDEEAIKAVKQWKFSPAKNKGQPVACWVTFAVNFKKE